ncbi:MAG: AAA family ATPase [Candidatus Liptonbacteria bacterium]|nr:AAA family ATPase [Candidatus Liptonbacteria bacterium]
MLKKLELSGFKSFAGKTSIDFAHGITAIVGPNGSGKSNVIDALRWLLGERDAKNLRGGKVEDLIFAGTPKKPRVGLAQASVHFDNTSSFFPVEFNEIVVSREVDRGGNSKYFLNKSEVRLRDLVDFFAKARLGVKGLIVIGQGESDMFLKATPIERREMMEEILGLREYQLKKAEAERKFKNTEVNLTQVQGLIKELAPHLRSLKRQTVKWEKRSEIQEELKKIETELFTFRLAEIKSNFLKIDPRIAEVEKGMGHGERELKALEVNVEATEGYDSKYHDEMKKIKADSLALSQEKSKLEKDLGRLEAQVEFLEERKTAGEEIDVMSAVPFIQKLKSRLEALLSSDLEVVKSALREIILEVNGLFRARKESGPNLETVQALHGKLVAKLAVINQSLDALRKRENEIAASLEARSGEFKKALMAREAKKDFIKELEVERNKILFERERWNLKLQDLELQAAQAGFKLLPELVENFPKAQLANLNTADHERAIYRLRGDLASMGDVDEALIKEAQETEERHTFLTAQHSDLSRALVDLTNLKQGLEAKINTEFQDAMKNINKEFLKYFELMFGGGRAKLEIKNPYTAEPSGFRQKAKIKIKEGDSIEENAEQENKEDEEKEPEQLGIDIEVSIPRKKITGLEMLSGGERSLVSTAVLFALVSVSPPPFLVLDEIDAALDERNTRRFAEMLTELSKKTQFVIVTHNRATMEAANVLYGVTMGDDGTSKVLSLKLE